ncbi:MAG: glycoside hydrolase family 65, partial [Oscillospiraceae bacterium]|nr:glycoside hydrolase family 65 [Oscillospiraceae bacterium]
MINRSELVRRHNPVLNSIDKDSPLTVGNGEFAFTADVTGFQSLYDEYDVFPLCTMSQWGWHTEPSETGLFTLDDVVPTIYTVGERSYSYFSQRHQGNEHIYDWMRHNPHRLNLARITLLWNGDEVKPDEVTDISQELDLYSGVISSEFRLYGVRVSVRTVCAYNADSVGFSIESPALGRELSVGILFPYSSHLISASDWQNEDRHNTYISRCYDGRVVLKRRL